MSDEKPKQGEAFDRFRKMLKKAISTPHEEIKRREKEWKARKKK